MFADWTRGELLSLIALPLWAIGTLANAAALQTPVVRRWLVSACMVAIIFLAAGVLWLGNRHEKVAVPDVPATPVKTPANKQTAAPTPQPTPQPVATSFIAEPPDPQAWRSGYCLVADFEGSLIPNGDKIDATITAANFDLCRYSQHGSRRVAVRVGVEVPSGRRTRMRWSSWTPVAVLAPGNSYSLEKPLNLSIPTRMRDLPASAIVVQVENQTCDTGKRNRYQLRSATDVSGN